MCPDSLGQTDLMWDKLGSTLETLAGHCHRVLTPACECDNKNLDVVQGQDSGHISRGRDVQGTHRPRQESTEKSCNIDETYLLIIGKWVRWVPASSITAAASIQPFIFAIPNTYIYIFCTTF
jgi:hypothetical protein